MADTNKYSEELQKFADKFNATTAVDTPVNILLFRDYLTKLFRWKKALGNDSEFIKSREAHNLFLDLRPEWINDLNPRRSLIKI